jgi:hypothetical protein
MRSPRFGPAWCTVVTHTALHTRTRASRVQDLSGCRDQLVMGARRRGYLAMLHDGGDACLTDRRGRSTRTTGSKPRVWPLRPSVTVVPRARQGCGHRTTTTATETREAPTHCLRGTHHMRSTTRTSREGLGEGQTASAHCKFKFRTPNAADPGSPALATRLGISVKSMGAGMGHGGASGARRTPTTQPCEHHLSQGSSRPGMPPKRSTWTIDSSTLGLDSL